MAEPTAAAEIAVQKLAEMFAKVLDEKLKPLGETSKRNDTFFTRLQEVTDQAAKKTDGELEKGIRFARSVKVIFASKQQVEKPAVMAAKMYPDDLVLQGAFKALETQTGTAGGLLVFPTFASEIIVLLRDTAVMRQAGVGVLPMPTDTLAIPRQTAGATASYVGEGVAPVPSQQAFDMVQLLAKKLISLVPISNDLLRAASVNADALVRDDIVLIMARREDLAFIRGDGAQNTPRGMRSAVNSANVQAQTGGTTPTVAQTIADVKNLIKFVKKGRKGLLVKPTWFMSTRSEMYLRMIRESGFWVFPEMNASASGLTPRGVGGVNTGVFQGFPYYVTDQIPDNLGAGTNGCATI